MNKKDVWFNSQGVKCAGFFYIPETDEKKPTIVMAHGLGAVKEMRLDAYAEEFCNAGFACLLFDYRYFGASDGEPRQLLDIDSQIKDWKAAIAYARDSEELSSKEIILFGSSFSGGHVLNLGAMNLGVSAIIAQCPFTDGLSSSLKIRIPTSLKLGALGAWDVIGSYLGRNPVYVKCAGKPSETALMNSEDSWDGFVNLLPEDKHAEDYPNKAAARIVFQILKSSPGKSVSKIKCPVLFCICDKDTITPAEKTLAYAKTAAKGHIKHYPVGHFDIYVGDSFNTVIRDQLQFLQEVL